MKGEIKGNKIIILVLVLILVGIGMGIWQYQRQNYRKKMIKFDACLVKCPKGGASCYLPESYNIQRCEAERICRAECREKYGITWEEYNKWKEGK